MSKPTSTFSAQTPADKFSTMDLPSTTESAQKTNPSRRRKGKNAKHRDAEGFRSKKNENFDQQLTSRLAALNESTSIESLFGAPRLMTAKPDVQFKISTKFVLEIVSSLIETLATACKVPVTQTDLHTLALVSVLQIDSKIWFAQQSSSFAIANSDVESRARRVKSVLPEAIFPLSFYIEQIGKVELGEQKLIPDLYDLTYNRVVEYLPSIGFAMVPPDVIVLESGNTLTGALQWVRVTNELAARDAGVIDGVLGNFTLTPHFLANPSAFPWLGTIAIEPPRDVLPTLDEVINRYNNLIGRINRRVNNAMVPVDYTQSRGTCAQLVTSLDHDGISMIDVWSNRPIDDDSLVTGALLRFGYNLIDVDDSHSRDFRCNESVIEGAGSLQRFVRNITSRLR